MPHRLRKGGGEVGASSVLLRIADSAAVGTAGEVGMPGDEIDGAQHVRRRVQGRNLLLTI